MNRIEAERQEAIEDERQRRLLRGIVAGVMMHQMSVIKNLPASFGDVVRASVRAADALLVELEWTEKEGHGK